MNQKQNIEDNLPVLYQKLQKSFEDSYQQQDVEELSRLLLGAIDPYAENLRIKYATLRKCTGSNDWRVGGEVEELILPLNPPEGDACNLTELFRQEVKHIQEDGSPIAQFCKEKTGLETKAGKQDFVEKTFCLKEFDTVIAWIKRFQYPSLQKLTFAVNFEEDVFLDRYEYDNNKDGYASGPIIIESIPYKVTGLVRHHGDSRDYGHYTYIERMKTGWRTFNDQIVESIESLPPEVEKDVYMLVLERDSTRQPIMNYLQTRPLLTNFYDILGITEPSTLSEVETISEDEITGAWKKKIPKGRWKRFNINEDETMAGHLNFVRDFLKESEKRTYYYNHPELWRLPVDQVEKKMKTADLNEKVTFTRADFEKFFKYLRDDVPGLANLKNDEIYVWAKICLDLLKDHIKDASAMTTHIESGRNKKYFKAVAKDVIGKMEESKGTTTSTI